MRRSDAEVAVLDPDGVIVRVNDAWERFCADNGGSPERCGVGVSYLTVAEEAAARAGDGGAAARMVDALRAALRGEFLAPGRLLLPCHTPQRRRWFETSVSSRFSDAGRPAGATVVLVEVPVGIDVAGEWAILNATPDGLMICDASGLVVWANTAMGELAGYPPDSLVGRPVDLLVPEAVRARHAVLRAGFVRSPAPRTMGEGRILSLRRADGRDVPVEVGLRSVVAGGEPMVLAAVRDLSERIRAAERDLVVTAALDSISDAVSVVDARTDERLYANRAALEFAGRPLEAMRRLPIGALADDEVRSRLKAAVDRVATGDLPAAVLTGSFAGTAGTAVPLEVRVTRIGGHPPRAGPLDGPGTPQDLVVLVGRDITDRVEAQRSLETSEALMRAVFEHTPIAAFLFAVDSDGRRTVLRGNAATADLLGIAPDELAGRDIEEFLFPEDRDSYRAIGRDLAALNRREYAGERRMRRHDGHPVWVDLRLSVVDLPGIGRTLLGHMVDITYRREMQRLASEQSAMNALRARVTAAVLAARPMADVLDLVVTGVAEVFEADTVCLAYPEPGEAGYRIEATAGLARTAGTLSVSHDLAARLAPHGHARLAPDEPRGHDWPPHGPGAAVRFQGDEATAGLLVAVRPEGAPAFEDAELHLLTGLGRQVQVALELSAARADQQRLALLEERQRIGRDLHDTVIQDLIALGMQLGIRARREPDVHQREVTEELVHLTDQAVRRLRGTVFDLSERPDRGPLSVALVRLVDDVARVLGYRPTLNVSGPVDDLPHELTEAALSALREALSNVFRHARADRASLAVSVSRGRRTSDARVLRLVVEDSGIGMPADVRRGDGIDNIRARAAAFHGHATWTAAPRGGTRLTWICPVPDDRH